MQSNIFVKVVPLLKEKEYDIASDKILNYLNRYHSNEWIYPDAMHRNLKLSIQIVYDILELCVENGILEQYLQIYCPNCRRFTGMCYKTIFDIPVDVECVHCDNVVKSPLQHAIVIYKVI